MLPLQSQAMHVCNMVACHNSSIHSSGQGMCVAGTQNSVCRFLLCVNVNPNGSNKQLHATGTEVSAAAAATRQDCAGSTAMYPTKQCALLHERRCGKEGTSWADISYTTHVTGFHAIAG